MGLAVNVTAPVPRFKSLPPAKAKFPAQTCALLFAEVTEAPELFPSVVEAEIVRLPVPSAYAEFTNKLPAFNFVPPLYVLPPESTNVPLPICITAPDPEINVVKSVP
jgi:hypothetical protein